VRHLSIATLRYDIKFATALRNQNIFKFGEGDKKEKILAYKKLYTALVSKQ
jgi:hypothetical protein